MIKGSIQRVPSYGRIAAWALISMALMATGSVLGTCIEKKKNPEMRYLERTAAVSEYNSALRDSASLDSLTFNLRSCRSAWIISPILADIESLEYGVRSRLEIVRDSREVARYEELESRNMETGRHIGLAGLLFGAAVAVGGFFTGNKWVYKIE